MTDDLIRRLEQEIDASLSFTSPREDRELQFTLDTQRILNASGTSTDYARTIGRLCLLIVHHVAEIEKVAENLDHLLNLSSLASSNLLLAVCEYLWNKITVKKQSLEDNLAVQVENVHRFNISLDQLVDVARTQLDVHKREYLDLTAAYEDVNSRLQQYQGIAARKTELHQDVLAALQAAEQGDGRWIQLERGSRLLQWQVEELQHYLAEYEAQRHELEQSMRKHLQVNDRLRSQLHVWEKLHAYSVPFEGRMHTAIEELPQFQAQQRLSKALPTVLGSLSSYADEIRTQFDTSFLNLQQGVDVTKLLYADARLGSNILTGRDEERRSEEGRGKEGRGEEYRSR